MTLCPIKLKPGRLYPILIPLPPEYYKLKYCTCVHKKKKNNSFTALY